MPDSGRGMGEKLQARELNVKNPSFHGCVNRTQTPLSRFVALLENRSRGLLRVLFAPLRGHVLRLLPKLLLTLWPVDPAQQHRQCFPETGTVELVDS